MERYTSKDDSGYYHLRYIHNRKYEPTKKDLIQRVGRYEDTWLEPAEVHTAVNTLNDYAAAARTIALYLDRFCNRSLDYPTMIADAARNAEAELKQVKRERDALCKYLAEILDCPCNFSPTDEEMFDFCGDDCACDNEQCWHKVAKMAMARS